MKKKIFLLLAIVAALTLVFVACKDPQTPEETTPVVTDAPTDPVETPTEEPTAPVETPTTPDETPTDKPTEPDETPTTEEPTEPETLPYKTPEEAGKVGISFDTFFVNGAMYFEDGMAGDKLAAIDNTITIKTGEACKSTALRGWVGFGQAIDSFGYCVNGYDFIYDAAFTAATEDGVKAAGGEFASRFEITVPLTGLTAGDYVIGFVAKLADGTVVLLRDPITVKIEKLAWNGSGIVTHQSFDQLYLGDGNADNSPDTNIFFTPGKSADWDFIASFADVAYGEMPATILTYWGWVGVVGELGQFGYQVNGGDPIFNDAWIHATEQPVIDAAIGSGGDTGSRMKISIDISALQGENTITVLYKNAEGNCVVLNEFTLITPVKPTHYDNYNVPQDQWVITGHNTQLNDASNGMVAAGGVESAALLHQGSIALGEIDLSKYSKVIVMWGCDNSDVTIGRYNENANNRIMLLNAEMSMVMSPAEETIIAGGTYELKGWAVTAFEIDLTNVDYNGPVWLAIDALPGTFALFYSVEFIGAEIDYSEPVGPETPDAPQYYEDVVVDLSQFADQPTYMPNFPAAGINVPLFNLGYANYIAIGEMDLSKYSKVEIIYSFDGSEATLNNFNNASSRAIGLKSTPTSYGQVTDDNFDGDIAHTDMEFAGGWTSYKTAVIDLSEITYSGAVYVTMHNPQGTTIAITGVKFFGAEIVSSEPEEPETPDEPETPAVENYNVPMESWTISGHQPQLITPNVDGIGPIVKAAGMEKAALLHQGSVGVGEVDLSKYSKVIIKYTADASQATYDLYNASGKQIYVLNANMHMVMSPDAATVVTSATYALPELNHSWQMQTIEIDLSAIDYSGNVFIAWDTLAGSFMVIASVEFVA